MDARRALREAASPPPPSPPSSRSARSSCRRTTSPPSSGCLPRGRARPRVARRRRDASSAWGLALGGIMLSAPLSGGASSATPGAPLAWGAAAGRLVFPPFFFGWRPFCRPEIPFSLWLRPGEVLGEIAGQSLLVALPEEAFYRGYLQSRLDEAWPPRAPRARRRLGPGSWSPAPSSPSGTSSPSPTRRASPSSSRRCSSAGSARARAASAPASSSTRCATCTRRASAAGYGALLTDCPRAALFDMDRTLLRRETASLWVRYQRDTGEASLVDALRVG